MAKDRNLFQKLSTLFKSGSVVKRKIRSFDTTTAVPDKIKSSGTLLFQKSISPTYATITSNAYNLSERLMRYQDFCLAGDTLVATPSEQGSMRIDEIVARWEAGERDFWTFSYDNESKSIVAAQITGAKFVGNREVVKVMLDDGSEIVCTPDHRFMLRDGSYQEARLLTSGVALMTLGSYDSVVYRIEKMNDVIPVYDVEVKKYHNFAVQVMQGVVIVHNCEMEQTPELSCVTIDSNVATPAGNFTIGDLLVAQEEAGEGWNFPVYSYDEQRGSLVIGNAHSVRKTKRAKVIGITLDSGETIKCTPDHLFLTRDGRWIQAQQLVSGDSLMPFYRENGKQKAGYNSVYTINHGWTLEHRFVAENCILNRGLKEYPEEVVHHVNLNKCDNSPGNLHVCSAQEHNEIHGREWSGWTPRVQEIAKKISLAMMGKPNSQKGTHGLWEHTPETKAKISQSITTLFEDSNYKARALAGLIEWSKSDEGRANMSRLTSERNKKWWATDSAYRQTMCEAARKHATELHQKPGFTQKFLQRRDEVFASYDESTRKELFGRPDENNGMFKGEVTTAFLLQEGLKYDTLNQLVSGWETDLFKSDKSKWQFISRRLVKAGYKNWDDYKTSYVATNHKVVSVQVLGTEDVYDLTVDTYHNFACNGVIVHNSALDLYADESVSQDEKGRSLHVYSDNGKIKELLEELFYDTLNVEYNLRMWVRNIVKYGDFFTYNDVHPNYGVVGSIPIPVNEIEREENFDRNDPFAVRFRWVTMGNRTLENWEVSHFRLLGNDLFLPYGASVIEPARRVWRQLILLEDAMLVYRVVRAPERRVFYVDVSGIPADAVDAYMEEQRKTMRTAPVVDQNTGRVDLRFNPLSIDEDYWLPVRGGETGTKIDTLAGLQNQGNVEDVAYLQKKLFAAIKVPRAYLGYDEALCVTGDTQIPLLEGQCVSIEQLASKSDLSNTWVYSCDEQGNIVPGKVTRAWKTKDVTELYEVTLDDGGIVRCTDNHPFMLRDGSYLRADELQAGQSLMPLYSKTSVSKKNGGEDLIDGYEMLLDNVDGVWKYTHKIVSDYVNGENQDRIKKQRVVHHKDFNKKNNSPENLQEMTWYTHRILHSQNLETTLMRPDVIERREPIRVAALKAPKHREKKRIQLIAQMADVDGKMYQWHHGIEAKESASRVLRDMWERPEYRATKIEQLRIQWADSAFKEEHSGENHWSRKKNSQYDIEWLKTFCKENAIRSIKKFGKDTPVKERYVGALLERNGYVDWRDFAKRELDIVVPNTGKKRNHKVCSIRVVQLDEPIAVYDLEVEKYHNFAIKEGIFIHNSSKATLSQLDIRFSRTIAVVQKTVVSELNKIAIIHLYAHGFADDDLQNFTLRLSNPSTVAQQQKLELWRAKFEIAGTAPEGVVSKNFVRREILGLNDEQIEVLDDERLAEKVIDMAIENAAPGDDSEEGSTPPAGGGGSSGGGGGGGDDLFGGGDEGGGEAGKPAEEPAGGEEAKAAKPEENAAEEPDEDEGPELELLTSSDVDEEDDFENNAILDSDGPPVKISKQLKRAMYNQDRRRHHGASQTFTPDLAKMTSHDEDSNNDPYDNDFFRTMGESAVLNLDRRVKKLDNYMKDALRQMEGSDKFRSKGVISKRLAGGGILTESDIQDEIDLLSERIDPLFGIDGNRELLEESVDVDIDFELENE